MTEEVGYGIALVVALLAPIVLLILVRVWNNASKKSVADNQHEPRDGDAQNIIIAEQRQTIADLRMQMATAEANVEATLKQAMTVALEQQRQNLTQTFNATLERQTAMERAAYDIAREQAVAAALQQQKAQLEADVERRLELSRRSTRAVNFGNHAQHTILPLMAAHTAQISTKDIHWLGSTMDFLCYKGLETENDPVHVVFADAKTVQDVAWFTNNAVKMNKYKCYNPATEVLNRRQQRVFDAILNGRVSVQIWLTDSAGKFACANYELGKQPTYIQIKE